jgi:hypothetical protein
MLIEKEQLRDEQMLERHIEVNGCAVREIHFDEEWRKPYLLNIIADIVYERIIQQAKEN